MEAVFIDYHSFCLSVTVKRPRLATSQSWTSHPHFHQKPIFLRDNVRIWTTNNFPNVRFVQKGLENWDTYILYFSIENWELRYVYYTQLRYPQFPWTMSHIPIKLTDPRQLFLSFQSKKQIPQDPLLCHQPHQTSFDISFETSKNLDRYFYQLQQLKPLGYTYHESSLTNSI